MIIRGHFIADVPYFSAHLRSQWFEGVIWLLADTGAARTTLLDRDVRYLGIPHEALEPAEIPIMGIGGSVRSFVLRNVEVTFAASASDFLLFQDIWAVQHNIEQLPLDEVARILRLPSVLGRDIINRFRFVCDYVAGKLLLERT